MNSGGLGGWGLAYLVLLVCHGCDGEGYPGKLGFQLRGRVELEVFWCV